MPMYILIFLKLIIDIICSNKSFNTLNTINIITLLLFIVLGIVGVMWNILYSNESAREITLISIDNITDQHFLGYFSLFVLFALQLDLTFVSGYCTYVLIIILIGIVYIKNSLFYINPLLNILGYSFYDITYQENENKEKIKTRIFCRKKINVNKKYIVKIKNENFAFLVKQRERSK